MPSHDPGSRMSRSKNVVGIGLLVAGVALIGGYLALARSGAPELPVYWSAPAFTLVDQHGDTVRTDDLHGTVWAVSFIFTNCKGVCPLISAKMARVRDTLAAEGLLGTRARLVSITADPARDTPGVLREYAETFGGSTAAEWAFLTGSPPAAVLRMIQEGFRVTAVDPATAPADTTAGYQVQHSPRILVVDARGRVRGAYSATEPGTVGRVVGNIHALVDDPGS